MELFGIAGSWRIIECNKMHQVLHLVALIMGGPFQLLDSLSYRKINFVTTF